jgi:ATP-dependent DNA helicase RecG
MQFYEQSVNIGRTPSYSGDALTLLKKLYLAKDHDSLTNAGILLFGKDPLKYFVTATFKIGRFGKSSSDLITQDVIEGNILEMADRILDILRTKYLKSLISYQGLKRIETLEYPEAALREAILNAIVHKDYANTYNYLRIYDDRLVIWNPGKLPFELTIERLKTDHSSVQRNPHIAGIFFKAGYIEAWGRGISKIIEACQAAGLPEPIFEEYQEGLRVTFLKDIFTEEYLKELGLADRYVKALIYIKSNGSITNSEYQKLLNVSKRTSTNDLQFLVDQNLILRTGTIGRGTHYKLAVRQA